MKRVLIGVGFTIILIAITTIFNVYFQSVKVKNEYKDYKIINYQLQGETYRFLLADNPGKWEKGLMYYRKLDGVDGMIFKFPDEDYRNFWNKNTLLDLKLFWIDNDKVIGTSQLPSIEKSKKIVTVSSPGKADIVIEMPVK